MADGFKKMEVSDPSSLTDFIEATSGSILSIISVSYYDFKKKFSIRSIRAWTMSSTTTIRTTSQSPILMPQLVFLMTPISRRSKGFSLPKNYSSCAGRRRYPWRPSSGFQVQCSESDEDWRCGTSEEHGCPCWWHSSNSFAEHGEKYGFFLLL